MAQREVVRWFKTRVVTKFDLELEAYVISQYSAILDTICSSRSNRALTCVRCFVRTPYSRSKLIDESSTSSSSLLLFWFNPRVLDLLVGTRLAERL